MPLAPGNDQATISRNISELTHHGSRPRSHDQIVAIALSNADRHPHAASGGSMDLSYDPPIDLSQYQRQPLSGMGAPPRHPDEEPAIQVRGDVGKPYNSVPPLSVTYRHSVPFAAGGGIADLAKVGIGAFHPPHMAAPTSKVMSPSEATPYWTRSAAHQMNAPMHGGIAHMASGGLMSASQASPWTERADARIMDQPFHGGLIGGSGAGRTDQIPLAVGGDSHVMPADVVSGLGQGHTLAGARILDASLKTGPYGVPFPHEARGHGPPAPPHISMAANDPGPTGIEKSMMTGLAGGGEAHGKTSILAASGEYVVPPEDVLALGRRIQAKDSKKHNQDPMTLGHEALDDLIKRTRDFNIAWLKHAPPPKKSTGGAIGFPLAA